MALQDYGGRVRREIEEKQNDDDGGGDYDSPDYVTDFFKPSDTFMLEYLTFMSQLTSIKMSDQYENDSKVRLAFQVNSHYVWTTIELLRRLTIDCRYQLQVGTQMTCPYLWNETKTKQN